MSTLETPPRTKTPHVPRLGDDLTERELQVLRVIALGGTEAFGGDRLVPPVSVNTFKTHTKHVFIKLGAVNRPHAVYLGFLLGWLVRQPEPPQEPFPRLDIDERDLLRFIAEGRSIRQIARALRCSEETVDNHLGRLYIRLGTNNRADAVRIGCLGGNLHVPAVPRRVPVHAFRPYHRFRSSTS